MKKTSYILGAICLVAVLFGVGIATGKGMEVHAEDTVVLGDLNNSSIADKEDAIVLEQYLTGETEITDTNVLDAADTNGDDAVNVKDLVRYRRYCTEASQKLSGSGSTNDPYLVENLSDLYYLSTSSTSNQYGGKIVVLTSDIMLNACKENWNPNPENELIREWSPIGTSVKAFQGEFCGSYNDIRYEIAGLYISTDQSYVGLFGNMGSNSSVRDVVLKNSYLEYTGSSDAYIGSIAGKSNATGDFLNLYSNATIKSTKNICGGIVGKFGGTVERDIVNCWFDGTIESAGRYCGGIVGRLRYKGTKNLVACLNTGIIRNTISSGTAYVGGICGGIDAQGSTGSKVMPSVDFDNCLVMGNLESTLAGGAIVGSIVSANDTNITDDSYEITIKDCYTTMNKEHIGSNTTYGTDDNATLTESKSIDVKYLNGIDAYRVTTLDFTNNSYWCAKKNTTPVLTTWKTMTEVEDVNVTSVMGKADISWYTGVASAIYEISSKEALRGVEIVSRVNQDHFGGETLKLTETIEDLSSPQDPWLPIGPDNARPFRGVFDGQGNTISGIFIDSDSMYLGLFGYVQDNGHIKDVYITDSFITSTNASDSAAVGSIAGYLIGQITQVKSDAKVVSAAANCGGIVGRFDGTSAKTISKCWFNGEVLSSSSYCGGIVGRVARGNKTISNCLNTGIINNTYNKTSAVYTAGICGGLVGAGTTATITVSNCVNEGTITVESKMLTEGKYAGTVVGNTVNTKTSNVDTITLSNLYTTKYVNNGNWVENQEYYKNADELNALVEVLNSTESGVWEYDSNTARLELLWYTGSTTTH